MIETYQTLHQMDLRGLGDGVRHRAPTKTLPRHAAREDEDSAVGVLLKMWQGFFEQGVVAFDVGVPALVPFVVAEGVEVIEAGEARPAGVADDDVDGVECLEREKKSLGGGDDGCLDLKSG
jgi:hypothetical protein